jgi:hypothetical protein
MNKPFKSNNKIVFVLLTLLGASSLVYSIVDDSAIIALVGLGLIFWGIVFIFVGDKNFVKSSLLKATVMPSLCTVEQLLVMLHYSGRGIYLPPKYSKDLEANIVYIPRQNTQELPSIEALQASADSLNLTDSDGVLLTSSGAELVRLFEKTLRVNLSKVSIDYLQQKLPTLFVEDLEIAQAMSISTKGETIHVEIEHSKFANLSLGTSKLAHVFETLGCPLTAALASAFAKTIGKPILIISQRIDEASESIAVDYQIILKG